MHQQTTYASSSPGYTKVHDKVTQIAWMALNCHLWYISKELVVLSFISPHINVESPWVVHQEEAEGASPL